MPFTDRVDAGKRLAEKLMQYMDQKDVLILAIPRGGVVIGFVLAQELHLPLDVIIVKKIPHPYSSEYAIGAAGLDEVAINQVVIKAEGISQSYIDEQVKELQDSIKERYHKFGSTSLDLKGKTIIVVDDGIATGYTTLAAVDILRKKHAKRIVLVVPVAPSSSLDLFKEKVDEIVCLETPKEFFAIGQFYDNFEQVSDDEVVRLLNESRKD